MNVVRALLRLHPAPFRERWGLDLEADASAAGPRSWPGLVAGAADMWLHPVVWPADSRAQRRGRAGVLALAVALFTLLFGQVAAEQGARLSSAPGGPWLVGLCEGLILLGVLLVAPRPVLPRAVAAVVLRRSARLLAAPALVATGVVVLAHLDRGPAGLWGHLAYDCWWASLAVGAVQVCRLVAGLGGVGVVPPARRRLRLGLWSLVAGSLLTGAVALSATLHSTGRDPVALTAGALVVLLACALSATLRDLGEV